MKFKMSLFAVLAVGCGILVGQNTIVRGQPLNRQLLGQDATWQGWIGLGGQVTDTVRLGFQANGDPQFVTVEFSTTYPPLERPLPAPGIINMVITEQPVNENTPEISMQTAGRSSAVATRLHSRRSISTSMSLDELEQLARAEAIIAQPFTDELRFSSEQTSTLQSVAIEWRRRLRR